MQTLSPTDLSVTPRGVRFLDRAAPPTLAVVRPWPSPVRPDDLVLRHRPRPDGSFFEVAQDCRFVLAPDARVPREALAFTVPAGFPTDLASVGRGGLVACGLLGVDPLVMAEASVAHDWHRKLAGRDSRKLKLADDVFRVILEQTKAASQEHIDMAYAVVRGHAATVVYSEAFAWLATVAPGVALRILSRVV